MSDMLQCNCGKSCTLGGRTADVPIGGSRLLAWGRCGYAFDLELAAAELFRQLLQVGHELFAPDECSAYLLSLEGRYRRVAKHPLQVERDDQDGEHVSCLTCCCCRPPH